MPVKIDVKKPPHRRNAVNIGQKRIYKRVVDALISSNGASSNYSLSNIGKMLETLVKNPESSDVNLEIRNLESKVSHTSRNMWSCVLNWNVPENENAVSGFSTSNWNIEDTKNEISNYQQIQEFFPNSVNAIRSLSKPLQPKRISETRASSFGRNVTIVLDDIPDERANISPRISLELKSNLTEMESYRESLTMKRQEMVRAFIDGISASLSTVTPRLPSPCEDESDGNDEDRDDDEDDDDDSSYVDGIGCGGGPLRSQNMLALTSEQEDLVTLILSCQNDSKLVIEEFNIPIYTRDIQTLRPSRWLNDEIINFYLNLIVKRGQDMNGVALKAYAFSTFFYPRLTKGGHDAVKRWTRKVDIFSYEILLVPIHLTAHWAFAAIDMNKREIQYYDSLGLKKSPCLNDLMQYLRTEHWQRKQKSMNIFGWQRLVMPCCQQQNADDCGVFACQFAEAVSRNVPIYFSQGMMPRMRRKMVYEISQAKLITKPVYSRFTT